MARKNSQARQAACRICGKDWQISALAVIPPSGYVCPVCENTEKPIGAARFSLPDWQQAPLWCSL